MSFAQSTKGILRGPVYVEDDETSLPVRVRDTVDESGKPVRKLLRRGVFNYQYVPWQFIRTAGPIEDQDWVAIGGTDRRTAYSYKMMVYFSDRRFGGFDRNVGIGYGATTIQRQPGSC